MDSNDCTVKNKSEYFVLSDLLIFASNKVKIFFRSILFAIIFSILFDERKYLG